LKDASSPTKHGDEVKFFVGASETIATLRLLGQEELVPGEEGWIQLELRNPVVTVRGDRYILRRPSPAETLGGGEVIDHQPKGRHKRFDQDVLKSLESLAQGSPVDVLIEAAMALNAASTKDVITKSRLEKSVAEMALKELVNNGQLIQLEKEEADSIVISAAQWNELIGKVHNILDTFHKQFPLRRGIPREELKSRLKLSARVFNASIKKLADSNQVMDAKGVVSRFGFEIKLEAGQQAKVKELIRKFESNPYATPSVKESQAEVGEDILNVLIESGDLIAVSQDVIFRASDYDEMVEKIKSAIHQNGQVTLGEVRDMLGTTRKYIQALLEHLDSVGVTMRAGDARKLK